MFYGENRAEIGKILRELSEWKGVHIIEAEVCPDHIHSGVHSLHKCTEKCKCEKIRGMLVSPHSKKVEKNIFQYNKCGAD